MRQTTAILAVLILLSLAVASSPAQQTPTTTATSSQASYLTVPTGTKVTFVFLRAEMAATAKAGDPVYMQVNYPVTVADHVAIPAGSFLLGTIQAFTKPTRKLSHAYVTVAFAKLILPSGHALPMSETHTLDIQVSPANDVLLDNGTQAEITLTDPLHVNAVRVAASLPLALLVKPGSLRSATYCVPEAGTPGTPGTIGTPDITIPGTPDTVIPGMNGMPDTVIPGTPSTTIAGTPSTPGDPGTPDVVCPNPPLVLSSTPATH